LLSKSDWSALVRFAVAQDMRTPEEYDRHAFIERHLLTGALDKAITRAMRELAAGRHAPSRPKSGVPDEEIQLTASVKERESKVEVELVAVVGSTSWMQFVKSSVRQLSPRAERLRWQIIQPCATRTWPTSDHPVVRLKRQGSIFIYGTGWLQKGTEIFMPLSPKYALYTQVGASAAVPAIASPEDTRLFVRALIGRAEYSVFADREGHKLVEWESTRRVDMEEFNKLHVRTNAHRARSTNGARGHSRAG
jgi:hypothetical protein